MPSVTKLNDTECSAVPTVEATEAVASAKIDAAQLKDLIIIIIIIIIKFVKCHTRSYTLQTFNTN